MPEIIQGSFISTGLRTKIALPVEVTQFDAWNYTNSATTGAIVGAVYNKWSLGMPDLGGTATYKNATDALLMITNTAANPGFRRYDESEPDFSAPQTVASITNAATFTVTGVAGLGGLQNGDVVILQGLTSAGNANNIAGFPIQVAAVNSGAGTFTNAFALANAPGQTSTGGFFRIQYSSPQPWYPTQRYIVNINTATDTITTSVAHGYLPGQTVAFSIPPTFGTSQLDGLSATILSVTASTFTVDLDLSAFSAFIWAPSVVGAFNFATVVPAYMNTAIANQLNVNPFNDARQTLATKGMILYPGTYGPAGVNGNEIFWSAISASSVMNM